MNSVQQMMQDFPAWKPKVNYREDVYLYWFLWLRESDAYRETCEAKGRVGSLQMRNMYEHWGDIHAIPNNVPSALGKATHTGKFAEAFSKWFADHIWMFCEPRPQEVTVLRPGDRVQAGTFAIAFGNNVPFEFAVRRAERQLGKLVGERLVSPIPGPSVARQTQALYPITHKPNVHSLKRALLVHRLSALEPKLKLHEIAARAGIGADIDRLPRKNAARSDKADERKNAVVQVCNIRLRAKQILAAVEAGVFPSQRS